MQELREPCLHAPTLALVVQSVDAATRDQTLTQRCSLRQLRLLLDEHDAQSVLSRHFAVIECDAGGDRLQQ